MEIIRTLLIVVLALVSLMLIGIILLQRSKSEGLGLAFGSGMGETLFGSRAGNVLTRITIILGVVFLVNTLVLANLFTRREASLAERGLREDVPAGADILVDDAPDANGDDGIAEWEPADPGEAEPLGEDR